MTDIQPQPPAEHDPLRAPDGSTDAAQAGTPETDADPMEPLEDAGRSVRTWVWMGSVSAFGLFLVFGSVPAHYWDENAAGTFYVPVQRGMQVLDVWRAQVAGLPDVSNQLALKVLFLGSVFAFLGLAVVALWLATVELWAEPANSSRSTDDDGAIEGGASSSAVPGVSAG